MEQIKTQNFTSTQENTFFFYCEVGQTLEEVTQTDCEVSIYEDPQKLTGHSPGQPAVANTA